MKPLIVANWKCNPTTLDEAREILNGVKEGMREIEKVEAIICPPFLYLPYWVEFFSKKEQKIKLGAQDCFWEEKGAFTGEISPKMLKNFGVEYIIIGHSERRKILGETDEMINKKIKAAIKEKIKPILCIGETLEERKKGKTFEILKRQLENNLKDLSPNTYNLKPLIVAYEPIWAIGTGNAYNPKEAKEVLIFLKKFTHQLINSSAPYNSEGIYSGSTNQLLYGGSVNSKNAASYIREANFQGLLVGGASLKAKEFIKIVKSISKIPQT